jgi:hypothetical protein
MRSTQNASRVRSSTGTMLATGRRCERPLTRHEFQRVEPMLTGRPNLRAPAHEEE